LTRTQLNSGVRLPQHREQSTMRPIIGATTALAALIWSGGLSAQAPVGTWRLLSRTDSSAAGVQPGDGPLGADPIAWIIYDSRSCIARFC
jgi:hypothetical protein